MNSKRLQSRNHQRGKIMKASKLVICVMIFSLLWAASPITALAHETVGESEYIHYQEEAYAIFVTTANLRMRTGPSLNSSIIKTVRQGARVQVTDTRDGEWLAVYFNGASGYMFSAYLVEIPELGALFLTDATQLHWPVQGPRAVNSPFGYRRNPFTGRTEFHGGLDLRAPHGTNILAAEAGVVIASGSVTGFGNRIIIEHGNDVQTLYAHNSAILVEVGQAVARGEVIARAGRTGRATGSHLHFELIVDGERIDPSPFLGI